MLEAGAGTGGLTKDALPLFETDMHHELLRYCATDITSAFSTGLMDAVRSPKLIFKVPALTIPSSAHLAHSPLLWRLASAHILPCVPPCSLTCKHSHVLNMLQNWDINEKLPAEVEGPFHVALATNVLHTGNNLKSERLAPPPASA